jgi:hypothetical protein
LEDVNNLERNKTVILECQNLEKKWIGSWVHAYTTLNYPLPMVT